MSDQAKTPVEIVLEPPAALGAEPATPDVASVSNGASTGKPGEAYLLCELCNAVVYDEDAHHALEHAEVGRLRDIAVPTDGAATTNAATAEAVGSLGAFVYETVRIADQGSAMFAVIQNATSQLRRLIHETLEAHPNVYLFGSCVSMGIWDGMGDADFTVIFPQLLAAQRLEMLKAQETTAQDDANDDPDEQEDAPPAAPVIEDDDDSDEMGDEDAAAADGNPFQEGEAEAAACAQDALPQATTPSPPQTTPAAPAPVKVLSARQQKELEGKCILDMARKLRDGGFKFEELEVLPRTRVPLVKRRSEAKRPYELRRLGEPYLIDITFAQFFQAKHFHAGNYGAKEVATETKNTRSGIRKTFEIQDGAAALRFFSRRESPGTTKQWTMHHRLPELFSVDFDISCRPFGIRNSWFLREYFAQDPIFRAGNLFVKQWSKQRGVNFSRQGYLTSYAMSCLWIYYLLRIGEAVFVDPSGTPFEPTPEQETIPYMPLWPFAVDSAEHTTQLARLGKLVRGFFHFYVHEFDYATEVVTLRRDVRDAADRMTREERGWVETQGLDSVLLRDRIYTDFCIEDVYENLNLGRHLTPLKVAWVRAQFADGLGCCDSGRFSELLLNPFDEAEETLRTALFRHLVQAGPCSIEALHAHLRTMAAHGVDHLATYELRHRFSDLWFDEAIQQSDKASAKYHGRRTDGWVPPVHPNSKGQWAADCIDDREPEPMKAKQRPRRVDEDAAAFGRRLVRLVSPSGEVLPSSNPEVVARYTALQDAFAKPGVREVGIAVPLHDMLRPLLANLFLAIDGGARLFDNFAAKTVFAEHLRLVAICLASAQQGNDAKTAGQQQPNARVPVGAVVKDKKQRGKKNATPQQQQQQVASLDDLTTAVIEQVHLRKLGSPQMSLIRYVLSCGAYVRTTPQGLLPTPQLSEYGGTMGAEESVQRAKTTYVNPRQNLPPQHNNNKANNNSKANNDSNNANANNNANNGRYRPKPRSAQARDPVSHTPEKNGNES